MQEMNHRFLSPIQSVSDEEYKTDRSNERPKNSSFKRIDLLAIVYFLLYWSGTVFGLKIVYRRLPLRTMSRMVGKLAKIKLPRHLRGPVYRSYGWLFGVKLHEAEFAHDLTRYENMSAFFQRRLRQSTHRIDPHSCLTSPADGRVLSCGPVEDGHLEQVKGLLYSLRGLLGPNTWTETVTDTDPLTHFDLQHTSHLHPIRLTTGVTVKLKPCMTSAGIAYIPVSLPKETQTTKEFGKSRSCSSCVRTPSIRKEDVEYASGLLLNRGKKFRKMSTRNAHASADEENLHPVNLIHTFQPLPAKIWCNNGWQTGLYHTLIYLSPADYHGFHSATDWTIHMRRHFPGKLYPAMPAFLTHHHQLYCSNERVVYIGKWQFGFFAYVAVGALNVGSIEVFSDPDLVTNRPNRTNKRRMERSHVTCGTVKYEDKYFDEPLSHKKGQLFGQFNFGSTIILIFEAPMQLFQFSTVTGSRVRVGESIGTLKQSQDE